MRTSSYTGYDYHTFSSEDLFVRLPAILIGYISFLLLLQKATQCSCIKTPIYHLSSARPQKSTESAGLHPCAGSRGQSAPCLSRHLEAEASCIPLALGPFFICKAVRATFSNLSLLSLVKIPVVTLSMTR